MFSFFTDQSLSIDLYQSLSLSIKARQSKFSRTSSSSKVPVRLSRQQSNGPRMAAENT